ncbi:hypothetical protein, partial [Kitasatospora putterlickiae]|uniref:hypothetical protein n=1 Tax=Kitasatospora putterlickiae TaxID=221725 RepID=UPI003CD05856
MTADRRTVLRTSVKLAALTAVGGLLTACGDTGRRRADPGPFTVRPDPLDPSAAVDPAWAGGEGPASPEPAAPESAASAP